MIASLHRMREPLASLARPSLLGLVPLAVLLVWITKAQQPAHFERIGVPFFWPTVQAITVCGAALSMLITAVGLMGSRTEWWARAIGSGWRAVGAAALLAWIPGLMLGLACVLSAFLLDTTVHGAAAALRVTLATLAVLTPLAALVPLLAFLQVRLWLAVLCWLLALLACIALQGHLLLGVHPTGIPLAADGRTVGRLFLLTSGCLLLSRIVAPPAA